jgi:two-component system, OmpR family, phosphate regulon response regulator PhoB
LERVKAVLRRIETAQEPSDMSEHMGIRVDRVRHQVMANDQRLDLTPTEFRLLECLIRQPGRAFSRHQLMDSAISEGSIVLERTIDVHIKTLRKKLGDVSDEFTEMIETVRGVGYRFRSNKSGNDVHHRDRFDRVTISRLDLARHRDCFFVGSA